MTKVIVFISIVICSLAQGGILERLYYKSANKNSYQEISNKEFISMQECFYKVLNDNNSSCLKQYGFKKIDIDNSIYAIVDTKKAGHGFYLIRKDSKSKYLLSLPHRFSDKNTGVIGMRLFREHSFKGAFFATATRRVKDMAHNTITPFNAFHIAYTKAYPDSHIYQLHGFTSKKRKTDSGKRAKIILSNGSKNYKQNLVKLSNCLKKSITPDVYIYGKDIMELGATTNAQIHSLHSLGFWGFTHIEMLYPIREELADKKSIRELFAKCLLEN